MRSINLTSFPGGWIDIKHTEKDGYWIEECQPTFSRISKPYASESEARAAFDADDVAWSDE